MQRACRVNPNAVRWVAVIAYANTAYARRRPRKGGLNRGKIAVRVGRIGNVMLPGCDMLRNFTARETERRKGSVYAG
jgi:hypothetical protein